MAQAATDLPGSMRPPAAAPPTAASKANVDDLLAQLAGEEIDRLLAEAESGRSPMSPAVASSPLAAAPAASPAARNDPVVSDPAAEIDKLFNELESSKTAKREREAAAAEQQSDGALLAAAPDGPSQSEAAQASADANDPAAPLRRAGDAQNAAGASLVSKVVAKESETSTAEREALQEGDSDQEPSPAPEREADSLLVRCLEFINAPLLACSEGVRGIIGKVALMTFLNAAAVLIYVLLIRPRH